MKAKLTLLLFSAIFFQSCTIFRPIIERVENLRFEKEILAFEQQDKEIEMDTGKILFVGSSSIRMWTSLESDMQPLDVLNRGFGGATTAEVYQYYDRIIQPYRPKVVVIYVGENDIAEGLKNSKVFDEVTHLFGKIKADFPDSKIVYLSMKPSIARWEMWSDFKKVNKQIKKLTAFYDSIYYIETADVMLNKDGSIRKDIFIEDGLHMNEKGYQDWTKLVKPVLESFFK
jgi:lysophospholipase L1-like esterase